jgi:indole-3-glycerol phosphate synthase
MKDFIVGSSQVQAGAAAGASAVLLILRCLSRADLEHLVAACREHRVTPLLECHDERELERALEIDGAVLGINNRDLGTLAIDRGCAQRLLPRVPTDRVVVAESGYATAADTQPLRGLADAVLIGSALMQSDDPAVLLAEITR